MAGQHVGGAVPSDPGEQIEQFDLINEGVTKIEKVGGDAMIEPLLDGVAIRACGQPASEDSKASTQDPQLRNLLVVVIDTLRADHLGAHGYERNTTPNIDQLAARGGIFTQAIATSSWTRASMGSGRAWDDRR